MTTQRETLGMTISATLETITPDSAVALLGINTHNRVVSSGRVNTLARDMAAGDWAMNGETIKISESGRLLDGQHRLLAVIQAETSVQMMVVRGLDDASQDTVDIGAKRHLSDVLTLAGENNTRNLAAATRYAWYLTNFGKPKQFGVNPSVTELQHYLNTNEGLRDGIPVGRRAHTSVLRYTPSVATSLHYLMGQKGGDAADEFWDHLIDGDTGPGNPIYALRESLLHDLSASHHMSIEHRAAITIKAWNYWREGRTIQTIGWRSSGKRAEAFPVLNGKSAEE